MRKRWVFVCYFLVAVLMNACATTASNPKAEENEKINIVWPAPPEKARIKFVNQFSTPKDLGLKKSFSRKVQSALFGDDDRQMNRPYAVAANSSWVAVADPGAAVVHVFDTKRKTYRQLSDTGDFNFASPIGVALDDERLYIADSELGKVFILNRRLKLVSTVEGFQRPTSLALDPVHHRLYVADTLAHQIKVFDLDGTALFTFGERGEADMQFNFPSHLAFANDRLFVNDTMNFRIQIFSSEGHHLNTFGKHGKGSGQFTQPKGVAVDSMGNVYVADALSNRVQIFAQDGTFLLDFGRAGDSPGAFQMPAGLAMWNDLIYVADSFNHRVQVFQFLREED